MRGAVSWMLGSDTMTRATSNSTPTHDAQSDAPAARQGLSKFENFTVSRNHSNSKEE